MKSGKSLLALVVLLCLAAAVALAADVTELKRRVVEIGGLDFKREVPVRYLDRAQLQEYVGRLFEQDYPQDLADREAEYLYWMGFSRERLDLKALRRRIILENVGGLYNEKTDELLAVEEFRRLDALHAPALVHELRHALQDQHVDLAAVLGELSDFDDRKLAALAAVEGDATLVMILQMGFDPERLGEALSLENVLRLSAGSEAAGLAQAPAVLRQQLLMPYLEGLKFSRAVLRERSWPGLHQALQRPPLSSEQVLHPDKYLAGETPAEVSTRFRPSRGEAYHAGVAGEHYLNVLLGEEGASAAAPSVAAGWGGDRFTLYRDGPARLLLWEAHWDDAGAAARFHAVFRRFLERRFGAALRRGRCRGRAFLQGSSAAGHFFLCRENARLFYARSNDRGKIEELISGGIYD